MTSLETYSGKRRKGKEKAILSFFVSIHAASNEFLHAFDAQWASFYNAKTAQLPACTHYLKPVPSFNPSLFLIRRQEAKSFPISAKVVACLRHKRANGQSWCVGRIEGVAGTSFVSPSSIQASEKWDCMLRLARLREGGYYNSNSWILLTSSQSSTALSDFN
jgi:hypothetical protein